MSSAETHEHELDGFAIVDFETTGLFPERDDRVVEVGVVRLDRDGALIDKYSSLVNPRRDVGATHIHGITASDVANAPTFSEVAGDLLALVRNTAFVAHNASFDLRFLRAEMTRLGVSLPDFPTLCTMRLATKIGKPIPGRKLSVLCEHFGIACDQAHAAIDDALATTELLRICVRELGGWSSADLWQHAKHESTTDRNGAWPSIRPSGRSHRRAHPAADR
jgi:DNA polymerase-3 subunit epsilon